MSTPTDHDLNQRIIELSKAVSALLDTADSPSDVTKLRDEALRAISEQSEEARKQLAHPSPED